MTFHLTAMLACEGIVVRWDHCLRWVFKHVRMKPPDIFDKTLRDIMISLNKCFVPESNQIVSGFGSAPPTLVWVWCAVCLELCFVPLICSHLSKVTYQADISSKCGGSLSLWHVYVPDFFNIRSGGDVGAATGKKEFSNICQHDTTGYF